MAGPSGRPRRASSACRIRLLPRCASSTAGSPAACATASSTRRIWSWSCTSLSEAAHASVIDMAVGSSPSRCTWMNRATAAFPAWSPSPTTTRWAATCSAAASPPALAVAGLAHRELVGDLPSGHAAGRLLRRVRDLVGQELVAVVRAGVVGPRGEEDVLPDGERPGAELGAERVGFRVAVHPDRAQRPVEPFLEIAVQVLGQRVAAADPGADPSDTPSSSEPPAGPVCNSRTVAWLPTARSGADAGVCFGCSGISTSGEL